MLKAPNLDDANHRAGSSSEGLGEDEPFGQQFKKQAQPKV